MPEHEVAAGHEAAAHETPGFLDAGYWDPAVFLQDPAFWAFVGLVIFLVAVIVVAKAPKMVAGQLDERAARIAADIKNAEELRRLAEQKLEAAKLRQEEAEKDAAEIIAAARREADQLAKESAKNIAENIARRQKMAEERIARAEADAMRDVRLASVDAASRAAETLLTEALAGKAGQDHYAQSLETVKKAIS
jgi:F-type H+-transporting ATPase subunit b